VKRFAFPLLFLVLSGPGLFAQPIFSRTVRAAVRQQVEIPFRGTGWVYLGELSSLRGIVYDERRLGFEGESFVIHADLPGTYILKFYKQDFVQDFIINDHVQVIVEGNAPFTASIRIVAEPRWPVLSDGPPLTAAVLRAETPAENPPESPPEPASDSDSEPPESPLGSGDPPVQAVPTAAPPAPEAGADGEAAARPLEAPQGPEAGAADGAAAEAASGAAASVRRAEAAFQAGQNAEALAILEEFSHAYPALSAEALYLYGQALEAAGPGRDIRAAISYYRRLIREYPQSPHYTEAHRRIAYLERYYINIR
jgi:hypothetical protein